MRAVIVGAGLAGLTCALSLRRQGLDVSVLEASDGVGGRVRTDVVDGYRLDRGFQVLFTAYPAARRQLNYDALHLRAFDPGAIIAKGSHTYVLSDPLRDPRSALSSAVTPIIRPLDKLLTALLAIELRAQSITQVLSGPDTTTLRYLRRRGFSGAYIQNFIRPFYGGVFLDPQLKTSAKCFKFDFKMLSEGFAAIPATGIGAIPEQLAEPLNREGRIKLKARVASLLKGDAGEVRGVRLADGTEVPADVTVLSVPAPEAARLSHRCMPEGQTSTVNLYWGGPKPVYAGKKLVLNANRDYFVNNAVQVTNIAPEYAPPGRHLLSATVLGVPEGDDDALLGLTMHDLYRMFRACREATDALGSYTPLKVYRIPYGQFAQPPGIHPHLPDNDSGVPNLYFASEFTEASSQNAAMISGEKAADLIVKRTGAHRF